MTVLYQALYRAWRPKTFDDVTGQTHVTKTLKTQVAQGRLSHAYLFTGTRGTGKTTCAKILAKAVNCQNPSHGNPCNVCSTCQGIDNGSILEVLELDAASNNGVEQIRALRDEAIYSPAYCKKRVYIVDEVHMLSTAAFNALLKILEEPPAHLMFILATTELHKVPATILSRCQRFSFKRLLPAEIQSRLAFVAAQEHLELTEDGASLLARLAEGSMRDALSLLDQCAGLEQTIDADFVLEILGLAGNRDTARLMEAVGRRDAPEALRILTRLYEGGREMGAILSALTGLARDLLILQTAPSQTALLTGGYQDDTLRSLLPHFTAARLAESIQLLQRTMDGFARSSNRRTDGEVCIIRLCDETLSQDISGILARLSKLEAALEKGALLAPLEAVADGRAQETIPPEPARDTPARHNTAEDAPAGDGEDDGTLPWELPSEQTPETPDADQPGGQPEPNPADMPPEQAEETPAPSADGPRQPEGKTGEAIWSAIEAEARQAILMPMFAVLRNPMLVELALEGQVLTIYTDTEATRKMAGDTETANVLADICSAKFGVPVTVQWKRKAPGGPTPPAAKPGRGNDSALQQENLRPESAEQAKPLPPQPAAEPEESGAQPDKLDTLLSLCDGLDAVVVDE